jgi:uncharacterized protein YdeI (YjbR/CyaY-like superfamily)
MSVYDPRFDEYIAKAQPFARPILKHLRKVVHAAVPDVEENWKWSNPAFDYKGVFCSMAAFKQHCIFGFWKHQLLIDRGVIEPDDTVLGHRGKITSVDDLPSEKALIRVLKAAAELNDKGIKIERPKAAPKPPPKVPTYLREALQGNKKAAAAFAAFSPSHKREYVEWVTEAKSEATRNRRLAQAVAWMAQGKPRNWKYM